MNRRDLMTLIGGAAAWPVAARAQAMPVVGFLDGASAGAGARYVTAFRKGLGETGYVEGQNVTIEYRWADDQYNRLPALVADLIARRVSVIAASGGSVSPLAAKAATTTIPIVFQVGANPVEIGLVASLSRPGGNLTGVTGLGGELIPKRMELLRELVPNIAIAAALVNPANPSAEKQEIDLRAAARSLGLQLHVLHASTERDFDTAFATLAGLRAGALLIAPDGVFRGQSEQLAVLSLRHGVPAIYQFREFAAAGGLLSYGGVDVADQYRLVGIYVGRILRGEKPGDLPVQQSTKVELIINLKTAKTLGITVPLALLTRADEVIE